MMGGRRKHDLHGEVGGWCISGLGRAGSRTASRLANQVPGRSPRYGTGRADTTGLSLVMTDIGIDLRWFDIFFFSFSFTRSVDTYLASFVFR